METTKKEFNLTWKKLILFAIIVGIYSAIMAILPIAKETSFADITISFEVWILFGIFIIMSSKSPKDSALKCFVFFLISQPIIYLLQVPFNSMGWGIFSYYKKWFIWTILTLPMGFIGWYMKKDKWWGLLILTPVILLLGYHYLVFLEEVMYSFPHHLLSTVFCVVTMFLYPIFIFSDKKIKFTGIAISLIVILATTSFMFLNKTTYNTEILINDGETGATFDDSYRVYLEDASYGNVYITYNEDIEDYLVEAEFKKTGKTNVILEDSDGNKTIFEIDIKNNTYDIKKK